MSVEGSFATAERFVPYGTSHWCAIAALAVGIVLILLVGRRLPRRFDRVFAVAIVAVNVPLQIIQFLPGEWNLQTSLPLQLCDWAWLVAAIALWKRSRLAGTITYLWALTLSIQGVLTPDLATPYPGARWWMFWAMHLLIIWAAVYVVWGMRIRPSWRTYAQTVAITFAWLVTTFAFNVVVGTNYGYVNGKPSRASALDLLGPWPWYVAAEIAIIATVWALLVAPWTPRSVNPARGPEQGP
jgi:hypothetical integral membrane protein (TIGR02206 family)